MTVLFKAVIFFVFVELSLSQQAKKTYSVAAESPFRIQKLNFILQKARSRLEPEELKSLFLELRNLDIEFLAAKQMRGDGKDPDGTVFRQTEKNLAKVLEEHHFSDILDSLDGMKHDKHGTSKVEDHHVNSVHSKIDNREFIKDKRLNKLWNKALDSGFTEDELLGLKEELLHHQKKLDTYDKMAAQVGRDAHENSVKYDTEEDRLELKSQLKSDRSRIEQELKELQTRIHSEDRPKVPFTHPRVKTLWFSAVASNSFTEKELESLKEELAHFQSRLEKLEFYKSEMTGSEKNLKKVGKDHLQSAEHTDHEQKVKHFAYKVDKLEKYLQARIMHSEL